MDSVSSRPRPSHRHKRRSLSESISLIGSYTIGWAAPNEQVRFLVDHGDVARWVGFRDGFMSKWTNLNIVCGLIMGAISTVMFADVELDSASFGLGVVSLLSSLIAIGFGTGLMYVLGDVSGKTLHEIGKRYPILFVFALSIPQVWAGICIISFFLCTGIFAWNASDKGWTVKAGIIGSAVLTAAHLVAFARLFHKQHTVETLIDDEPETGMDHNIHLAHLKHAMVGSTEKFKDSSLSGSPPTRPEYVTQFGGSGAGHFVASPPAQVAERRIQSRPLVESPDPSSTVFPTIQRAGTSGDKTSVAGKGKLRSREGSELEPVDLFSATGGAARV